MPEDALADLRETPLSLLHERAHKDRRLKMHHARLFPWTLLRTQPLHVRLFFKLSAICCTASSCLPIPVLMSPFQPTSFQ